MCRKFHSTQLTYADQAMDRVSSAMGFPTSTNYIDKHALLVTSPGQQIVN